MRSSRSTIGKARRVTADHDGPGEFKYRAFISYSHVDEAWARWLHGALETYRLPRHLVGRETEFGPVPERLAPVFRDREELASATSLGETLTRALQQSATQIVICSPAAAKSRWVNEEILTYKRLGRERRIFCLIIGGEPGDPQQECFPNALSFTMGADGELTRERCELIAADVRPGKDGKLDAKLKLVAGMLGVGLDELRQREAHRQRVRTTIIVGCSLAGMAITSSLALAAWFARNEAERQRVRAEFEAETARQTTQFMVDLFKVSDPSESLGNSITAREILDKGASRIQRELADQPAIQATLMDTMGAVYTRLGLYNSALPLIRQAYEKRLKLWGNDHVEVASSLLHLGNVLTHKADYEEAERYLRVALATRTRLHGLDSVEVAETRMRLAKVMTDTGRYPEAEALLREVLAVRTQKLGPRHPEVASCIEAIGLNYYDRGEYEESVSNLRLALDMRREQYPGGHPNLATAIANLASVLMDLGQLEEAVTLEREALEMKRRLYGGSHPETAATLNNLGYTLELLGDDDGAEQAYREALAMNRTLLGDSHPAVAVILGNLAFVLDRKGQRRAAMDLMREALVMSRATLGPKHPDVAARGTALAYWLTEAGDYDEAARLLEESIAIRRDALGPDHPQVAGTLTVQSNLLLTTGRYEEARVVAVEAQRIIKLSLPDDSWQAAAARNSEGAALTRLRRFAEAEKLLLESLDGLQRAPIPDLAERGRARLAELYVAWGRAEEARRYQLAGAAPGS
jgi:tetratricopeptide (TPR) repeat protein